MILHTNYGTRANADIVFHAIRAAYQAGKISLDVHLADGFHAAGSRTHLYAVHFQLEYTGAKVKGDGRRPRNSGTRGAAYGSLSATWDEHGYVMAQIFRLDSTARFGSASRPVYDGADDFHAKTGYAYHSCAPHGVAYGIRYYPTGPVKALTVDRDMAQINLNLARRNNWPDAVGIVVPLTSGGSVSANAYNLGTFDAGRFATVGQEA